MVGTHSGESTIFFYHPNNVSTYDRVFIFAHELGHALHQALTLDIERIPEGFDKFNDALNLKDLALKDKQEMFADAVAFAVLNCDELKCHIPAKFMPQLLPFFDKYIKYVTDRYFKVLTGKA